MKWLLALAVWMGMASASHAEIVAKETAFRSWRAVCDGLGECAAWGMGETWAQPGYVIVRHSNKGDTIRIGADGLNKSKRWVMAVQIVDARGRTLWAGQFRGEGNGRAPTVEVSSRESPKARAALRAGAAARISFDAAKEPAAVVSLSGSAAAMDWTRAQAGFRAERPVVYRARAVDQRNLPALKPPRADECEAFGGEPEIFRARLAQARIIWIRTCRAGYNNDSELFLTDEAGRALPSPDIKHLDEPVVGMLGQQNLRYDPKTRTLSSTTWQRQMGGCGDRAEWVWDGAAFQFSMFLSFDECHGVDVRDWPVRYRARVINK